MEYQEAGKEEPREERREVDTGKKTEHGEEKRGKILFARDECARAWGGWVARYCSVLRHVYMRDKKKRVISSFELHLSLSATRFPAQIWIRFLHMPIDSCVRISHLPECGACCPLPWKTASHPRKPRLRHWNDGTFTRPANSHHLFPM